MNESGFKILIVDDDADLRALLKESIRNWGFVADTAFNGDDALTRIQSEHYDIIISDLMMPGMDGMTLLQRVKEKDKEILFIIITGYATIETAVRAINIGAYDYIAKPFRLDELMVVIRNACERLKLISQNKTLLEELKNVYSEITTLKGSLASVAAAQDDDKNND